jgi:hypothetical protein
MMPTLKRRIQLSVDGDVFRVLALDPERHGAVPVSAALARYAQHIARASREVEYLLDRDEWNLLADVLKGRDTLRDHPGRPLSHLLLIKAMVEDGHRLDGVGYKWFGNEAGDARVRALVKRLNGLSDLHGDAIAAAVRYYWDAHERVDRQNDEWWKLAFRTQEAGRGTHVP